jgi:hypothetical protein
MLDEHVGLEVTLNKLEAVEIGQTHPSQVPMNDIYVMNCQPAWVIILDYDTYDIAGQLQHLRANMFIRFNVYDTKEDIRC